MSEMGALLEVKGISKAFPGVQALNNVNFSLKRGNIHALVGENGAGKSTLIKILSGVHAQDKGEIYIDSERIDIGNPRHAHKIGIFTIHQELSLAPNMSISENVFLGIDKPVKFGSFIEWRDLNRRTSEILKKLGIEIDPNTKIKDLKVGDQQMVEIAKSLVTDPKILILDEPTSALSAKEIHYLFTVLKRLKAAGYSVIYISHRLEEIFEIADTVTVLRDGEEVTTTTIDELDEASITRLMTGKDISLIDRKTFRKHYEAGNTILNVKNLSGAGVHNIDFMLRKNEILGLAGLMGSGRSEIAKLIFGAYEKESGIIELDDSEIRINSPKDALSYGIAYTTEDRKNEGLLLEQSVKFNITISVLKEIAKLGWIGAEENKIANDAVKSYNIVTSGLNRKIKNLSGGNQQKAIIARALACKLKIIVLDEPTKGIDVGAKQEIYNLVKDLADAGMSVIFISSELSEVVDVADRLLLVKDGRITAQMERNEATKDKVLEKLLMEEKDAKVD